MTKIETFLGQLLNPFVRLLAVFGPMEGVAIAKVFAFALGGITLWLRRDRVFHIINYDFALIVIRNMIMILRALGQLSSWAVPCDRL